MATVTALQGAARRHPCSRTSVSAASAQLAGLCLVGMNAYSHNARRAPAGPTAKLEHVAERFSAFYTDLEQEKQVGT